jgi:hypothetical protein
MLCLGGGPSARRFQQSAGFIFNMYTMEMRRKLGGVAFVAQKKILIVQLQLKKYQKLVILTIY